MISRQSGSGGAWINVLLGIWVIISPFVLGFALLPRAMWNNVVAGIIVAVLALVRTGPARQAGWSWANVILGVWLIISPFVLAFVSTTAVWNNVILGIITLIVAWANAAATRSHATA
ncbi:MAG: SPW repeat protein [Chthoniobacterales bacterium]